jgi:hypothetical protein
MRNRRPCSVRDLVGVIRFLGARKSDPEGIV